MLRTAKREKLIKITLSSKREKARTLKKIITVFCIALREFKILLIIKSKA